MPTSANARQNWRPRSIECIRYVEWLCTFEIMIELVAKVYDYELSRYVDILPPNKPYHLSFFLFPFSPTLLLSLDLSSNGLSVLYFPLGVSISSIILQVLLCSVPLRFVAQLLAVSITHGWRRVGIVLTRARRRVHLLPFSRCLHFLLMSDQLHTELKLTLRGALTKGLVPDVTPMAKSALF